MIQKSILSILLTTSILTLSSYLRKPMVKVKNFHKVSQTLYRSAQPNKKEMQQLKNYGINTIINLRNSLSDKQEVKNSGLKLIEIPIKTKKISYEDMVDAMIAFRDAPKPVLVHCRRGSDRTGCFVACYRMLFEDVSREEAKKELLDEDLGYYQNLFPNIAAFVDTVDIERIKRSILRNE